MQSVTVAIEIEPRDIPALLCSRRLDSSRLDEYIATLAEAVAEVLDLQDFLSRPERVHELQRLLWEQNRSTQNQELAREPVGPLTGGAGRPSTQ